MKIAIVTDTHFGFKNDSPIFLEAYLSFFEQQFFPYLLKNNIRHVIHMGDVLDRRKFVNFNTLRAVRKRFSEWFTKHGVSVHCVIGNHDCYWKNTNEVNSTVEIFGNHFHKIYENPEDVYLDGLVCGFVPWISKENSEQVKKYLENSNADVLFGHFEITGYEVVRGVRHEGGLDPSVLSRFNQIYSGHFHCKQENGNIHYLGTPYEMFYSEANETKGFHVLDTKTRELEFVENTRKLYYKVVYDLTLDDKGHGNFNFSKFKDSFVKVVVTSKKNQPKFDMFCDKLFEAGIHDLQIVDSMEDQENGSEDSFVSEKELSKNTIDLIDGYIDDLKIDGGSDLKSLMREIYAESLSL
jgi:DNA repair exonuclease SbcCD nuclease subunit